MFYALNSNRKYVQVDGMYFYIKTKDEIERHSPQNKVDTILFENDRILFNDEVFRYKYDKGYKQHTLDFYDANDTKFFSFQSQKLSNLQSIHKYDFESMSNETMSFSVTGYEDSTFASTSADPFDDLGYVLTNATIVHIQYQSFVRLSNIILCTLLVIWAFSYVLFIKKYRIRNNKAIKQHILM